MRKKEARDLIMGMLGLQSGSVKKASKRKKRKHLRINKAKHARANKRKVKQDRALIIEFANYDGLNDIYHFYEVTDCEGIVVTIGSFSYIVFSDIPTDRREYIKYISSEFYGYEVAGNDEVREMIKEITSCKI